MRRLLLSAAALVLIAGSAAAQNQTDEHPHHEDHQTRDTTRPAAPARPAEAPGMARPAFTPPTGPTGGGRGQFQGFRPQGAPPVQGPRTQQFTPRTYQAPPANEGARGNGPNSFSPEERRAPGANTPAYRTPHNGGPAGHRNGWNQPGGHGHVWNRDTGQRNTGQRSDWWRGHRGFQNYQGWRQGYWFAPGWGYYQPDPQYYDYDWEVGDIVPYDLRGYYVSDPYDYGLPPPAYGTMWIFLGDELVMIDQYSGVIVQIGEGY